MPEKSQLLDISPFGPEAISVAFEQRISEQILGQVLGLKSWLDTKNFDGIDEVIHSYASLVVRFDREQISRRELINLISSYGPPSDEQNLATLIHRIPVCYNPQFGPDQEAFLKQTENDFDSMVDRHTSRAYRFYFYGFLPGFMYLGGMDPTLHCSRKQTPSFRVHAGSVAIGGEQTGIYSIESPGGWSVIGRTPCALFSGSSPEIQPGELVQFYAVSEEEFEAIAEEVRNGRFQIETLEQ